MGGKEKKKKLLKGGFNGRKRLRKMKETPKTCFQWLKKKKKPPKSGFS